MQVIVTYNAGALQQMIAGLDEAASGAFRTKLAGAIDAVGAALHEALIEPLKIQTGLTTGTIPRALHDIGASGSLAYSIWARGGDISLRYFGAHETGGGVSASPRGRRTFYPGAFRRSGRDPRRMSQKLNTQVYRATADGKKIQHRQSAGPRRDKWSGSWGRAFTKIKSGVFIPDELVRGAAKTVFETMVATRFEPEIAGLLTSIVQR